ncbi:MAG: AMP-dependent synthetase [Ruminococcaceae bacterium]|nr:AMP-dependent synthetase [Oscillospiraceae bacterium]
MKLSFSTRGWGHLGFDRFCEEALNCRFSGIELHDVHKYPELFESEAPLNKYSLSSTLRYLKGENISLPCLDTSFDISSETDNEIIFSNMQLAKDMQIYYVSVCAGKDDPEAIEKELKILTEKAEELGLCILVKTTGVFGDTSRLRTVLDSFASDELAALWDMHHTYRNNGESADTTIKNLGAYVRHVHLRDSDESGNYELVGEGSLPISDMMGALYSINYDGFISLEWRPEWMSELDDCEIIFPHFVNYMKKFDNPRGKKKELYFNHDHSGQYVWKKDEIIEYTFSQVLDRMVEEFPDQYAFKYTTLDYTRTYSEFRDDVDNFARALVSMGVKPGTKVAVWATNVPAWYISFWATTKIGAVLVTVNTAYKIHELEYLLRQSDSHTLVMIESALDSNYAKIINELCPEIASSVPGKPLHCKRLPVLRNVISVGFKQPGCLTFDETMKRASLVPKEEIYRMAAAVRPDDVCNMQYTSGTTGFPKGVMLTHYNVVNNGKCIGDRMGLSTADRMMIQVPMFHCFGMVLAMTASMTHGATLCPLPYFSAKSSLACINQEHITCFHGVPTMFIAMFNHEDYAKTDFSYMRTGIMAGAGCPPELMRKVASPEGMNMRGIVSVYGQTESSPGSTMSSWEDPLDLRCDTVGYAFPHVECKVIDPETGEEVPDGVNGEFCSRGYNLMKGYYKMPEATKATIDSEGWLHSGDLACKRADGCYLITGRLKDMIIRGGENIYPKEIEEFLYTNDKIKDVQVIGVPDEKYGEEIMACIVLKEPGSMTEEEVKSYVRGHMARHKIPRYVDFVDSFPMNAAGKILKYKMREAAAEKLGLKKS